MSEQSETMTKEQALAVLVALENDPDAEYAHGKADEALCALLRHLGHEDVVNAYDQIHKWYT